MLEGMTDLLSIVATHYISSGVAHAACMALPVA